MVDVMCRLDSNDCVEYSIGVFVNVPLTKSERQTRQIIWIQKAKN
jgi:hypothetical protein